MNECTEVCKKNNSPCRQCECRLWVDYPSDLNCVAVSIEKHGQLTLKEAAKRLGVSHVRIKQIQDKALKKIKKFI